MIIITMPIVASTIISNQSTFLQNAYIIHKFVSGQRSTTILELLENVSLVLSSKDISSFVNFITVVSFV